MRCRFPCLLGLLGAQGMEPMLAVDRRGTMFMGIATNKGLYEQPGELTGV